MARSGREAGVGPEMAKAPASCSACAAGEAEAAALSAAASSAAGAPQATTPLLAPRLQPLAGGRSSSPVSEAAWKQVAGENGASAGATRVALTLASHVGPLEC